MTHSTYTCLVCKRPLCKRVKITGYIILWCGWGPCISRAANDGEAGVTDEEAYRRLCAKIADGGMRGEEP